MKMMNKFCALMLSVALCAGMAAPAFAYGGEPVEEVEQPVLTSTTDEEDSQQTNSPLLAVVANRGLLYIIVLLLQNRFSLNLNNLQFSLHNI